MFNVGSIVGELVLKDEFSGELKKGVNESEKATQRLKMQLAAVSAAALALGAAMAAAAKATANYRDETTKAARRAGMNVEEFSKLRHAAELSGIQFNELAISMSKLASPEAEKRLARLGISMKNLDGTAKDNSEIFAEVADRVAEAGTASEKTRIAVAAFGEEGSKMVSMLDNGSEGLARLKQEAVDLGIAFDEEAGKQAELFNDNLDRLGKSIQGVRDSLGQAIIEFINSTGIVEMLTDAIASISRWFNNLDQSTKDIIVTLGAVVVAIGALIGAFLIIQTIGPAVGAAVTAAFGPIGIIVAVVAAKVAILVGAIVLLVKNWERFGRAVAPIERVFKSIQAVFANLWESIKEAVPVVKDLFSEDAGKGFIDYLIDGLMVVIKAIGTVILVVEDLISTIPKLFKEIGMYMTGLWQQMKFEAKVFKNEEEKEMLEYIKMLNAGTASRIEKLISDSGSNIKNKVNDLWDIELGPANRGGEDQADAFTDGVQNGLDANKSDIQNKVSNIWKEVGEKGVSSFGFEKIFQTLPDEWQADIGRGFQGIEEEGEISAEKIQEAFEGSAKALTKSFSEIADGYLEMLNAVAEATRAQAQRTKDITTLLGDLQMREMQKLHDAEVEAIEQAERDKIAAIKNGQIERLALIDEEFARRKEAMDLEFQQMVARERAEYELKLKRLQQESADQEQARLATTIMEEDWRKYLEKLEQQHNDNLLDEEGKKKKQEENIERNTQEKITEIQEKSADRKEALNQKKEENEKKHAKQMAWIQYAIDLFTYEASKKAAIAEATFKYASSLMSAVQSGASLAGMFPPFSIPLGLALTATLVSMSTTAYNASLAAINATKPLPSPEMFAKEGGRIEGPRHASGGVNVNAEGGEMFLSRDLTNRVERMVERDEQGQLGREMIQFSSGAIIVYGNMDEGMVDILSDRIASRIEQRRF